MGMEWLKKHDGQRSEAGDEVQSSPGGAGVGGEDADPPHLLLLPLARARRQQQEEVQDRGGFGEPAGVPGHRERDNPEAALARRGHHLQASWRCQPSPLWKGKCQQLGTVNWYTLDSSHILDCQSMFFVTFWVKWWFPENIWRIHWPATFCVPPHNMPLNRGKCDF